MNEAGGTDLQSLYLSMGFEITRQWPDGLVEIQFTNGRRWRGQFIRCVECAIRLPESKFEPPSPLEVAAGRGNPAPVCAYCREDARQRRYEADAPEREQMEKAKAFWDHHDKMEKLSQSQYRRSTMMTFARVKWRDVAKIQAVYVRARLLTTETGIPHAVDHYYPIQGEFCCGLHVHENLRIVTRSLNAAKKNIMPMESSPAIKWLIDEGKPALDKFRGEIYSFQQSS